MYTTSYLCASDLNRFMTRRTIQELELDDEPAHFYIDDIEEHGDNRSPNQHQMTGPLFMPSYFSSMLHMNYTDVWRVLRPRTHELVSPDDEIIHSTGRTQHTHSGAWSPLRTGSVPIYNNHHWQPNPCSPSLSFSSSSLPLNEEERQIHRPCGKCADPASMYSSDSSDSGTDDTSDTTFVRSPTAIKIPKRGSSRLSRIMRQMEDSGVWYLYLSSDRYWWFISCQILIFSLLVYNFWTQ